MQFTCLEVYGGIQYGGIVVKISLVQENDNQKICQGHRGGKHRRVRRENRLGAKERKKTKSTLLGIMRTCWGQILTNCQCRN